MSASVISSTPAATILSVATRPAQPSSTQTLESHTIDLFNIPHTATASANPLSHLTGTDQQNETAYANPLVPKATPNFSRPVLGALLGGIIAIAVFLIIVLVRRRLMRTRRRRADSARSRAAVLQMQMDEANGVTRRAVFGEVPGNRLSTYSAYSTYSHAGSTYV
jgi:hypothetical protein